MFFFIYTIFTQKWPLFNYPFTIVEIFEVVVCSFGIFEGLLVHKSYIAKNPTRKKFQFNESEILAKKSLPNLGFILPSMIHTYP